MALAIDAQDNVYVLNQGTGSNGTLQKFNSTRIYWALWQADGQRDGGGAH